MQHGTWSRDYAENVGGYWILGAPRRDVFKLADAERRPFGSHLSYEAAAAKAVDYAEADAERDSSPWFVACEWQSPALLAQGPPDTIDPEEGITFHNGNGPGTAYAQAKALYRQICLEPEACGCAWWGRVSGWATDAMERHDEETADICPADAEEAREQALDRYLEENHDAIVAQERMEMWQREY